MSQVSVSAGNVKQFLPLPLQQDHAVMLVVSLPLLLITQAEIVAEHRLEQFAFAKLILTCCAALAGRALRARPGPRPVPAGNWQ